MFAYIPFGSSKSALPGELENDLAYSSNLDGAWLLSIYMCARSIDEDDEEMKRDTNRAKSVGRNRIALRESRILGQRAR